MKRILTILSFLLVAPSFGNDIIRISSGHSYVGRIYGIEEMEILFTGINQTDYAVPISDILSIKFEDPDTEIANEFKQLTSELMEYEVMTDGTELPIGNSDDPYLQGRYDAQGYHGKGGGYFAAGVFLGPAGYLFLIGDNRFTPNNAKFREEFVFDRDLDDWQYMQGYELACKRRQASFITGGVAINTLLSLMILVLL